MLQWVASLWYRLFPGYSQKRADIQYGIVKFLENFAYIQLIPDEFVWLNPPHGRIGDILVTALGGRPLLKYKYWPKKLEYREELPEISVILEDSRIQVRTSDAAEWETVQLEDARIQPLHSMFQGFAFYSPLRVEYKQKANISSPSGEVKSEPEGVSVQV